MANTLSTIFFLLACLCISHTLAEKKFVFQHPHSDGKHHGILDHHDFMPGSIGHLPTLDPHVIFSDSLLQPDVPAAANPAPPVLIKILPVWKDLDVLVILIRKFPSLVKVLSASKPHLIFAPTNHAFLTIVQLFYPDTPKDVSPEVIVKLLVKAWGILLKLKIYIPPLEEILAYHLVEGEWPEHKIVKAGYLETLQGGILGTKRYPLDIKDQNTLFKSRRLGLQISGKNGRISFIDELLLPFDLRGLVVVLETGIMHPEEQYLPTLPEDILFKPFRSIADFVTRRNDISIITTIVINDPVLLKVITSAKYLHVFAPNNMAFLKFIAELVPEKLFATLVPLGTKKTLTSQKELRAVAIRVVKLFLSVPGLPSLRDIILYHIVKTTASFDELVAIGKVPTLFQGFPIKVTKTAVIDLNSVGPDPAKIVTLGTRNGFVTVLKGVLLPVELKIIIRIIIIFFQPEIEKVEVEKKKPHPAPHPVIVDPYKGLYHGHSKKPSF